VKCQETTVNLHTARIAKKHQLIMQQLATTSAISDFGWKWSFALDQPIYLLQTPHCNCKFTAIRHFVIIMLENNINLVQYPYIIMHYTMNPESKKHT
jgi:hypothetical protein